MKLKRFKGHILQNYEKKEKVFLSAELMTTYRKLSLIEIHTDKLDRVYIFEVLKRFLTSKRNIYHCMNFS